MEHARSWTRVVAGSMVLFFGTLTALPAGAAEPLTLAKNTAPRPLAAAATAKANELGASARLAAAPAAQTGETPSSGGSFFHSTTGVIAIVLMTGVLAWTVESRINNAVHSPARK
jgi:hypothetical protein